MIEYIKSLSVITGAEKKKTKTNVSVFSSLKPLVCLQLMRQTLQCG